MCANDQQTCILEKKKKERQFEILYKATYWLGCILACLGDKNYQIVWWHVVLSKLIPTSAGSHLVMQVVLHDRAIQGRIELGKACIP